MDYKRQQIYGGDFLFGLPLDEEKFTFYKSPDLPKITFKRNGRTYTVTDIRLLNETAVNTLLAIISECATREDVDRVAFKIEKEMDHGLLDAVTDIVTGISHAVKRGGRKGFSSSGCFLVSGFDMTEDHSGEKTIQFHIITQHAKIVYEYAQQHKDDGNLNWYDLITAVADKSADEWDDLAKAIENGEIK